MVPFCDPRALVVLPTDKSVIVGDTRGIYRLKADATTWERLNVNPVADLQQSYKPTGTVSALAAAPISGGRSEIVASFSVTNTNYDYGCLAGLYISRDSGDTWTQINVDDYFSSVNGYQHDSLNATCQGWYDNAVAINPTNPDEIVVGGITIMRSVDGGTYWQNLGTSYNIHPDIHALAYDKSGNLYVGEDGGIIKFPAGASPLELNQNLVITQFYGNGAFSGQTIFAGSQDNGTSKLNDALTVRSDGTLPTWTQIMEGDGGNTIVNPTQPSRIYAEYYSGNLQSTDVGGGINNWVSIRPPTLAVGWVMPYVVTDDWNTIIAGGDNVYRTTRGGKKQSPNDEPWSSLGPWPTPGPDETNAPYVTTLWASGDGKTIVAGRTDGKLAKVFSDGNSLPWIRESFKGVIDSVVVDPSNYAHAFISVGNTYIDPRTTKCDIMETQGFDQPAPRWNSIKSDTLDCNATTLALFQGRLFVATSRSVYERVGPFQWITVGSGLPVVPVTALLFIPPQSLVALTHGRGAWYLQNINP